MAKKHRNLGFHPFNFLDGININIIIYLELHPQVCLGCFFSEACAKHVSEIMSAHGKVQQLAAAATQLLERCRGTLPSTSTLRKVAAIGAHGKFSSNCERDLQRLILKAGAAIDVDIERIRVHLYNPKTEEESLQNLSVIFPDKLAAALYEQNIALFETVFFGDKVDAEDFWNHCRNNAPWMEGHPAAESGRPGKLIPMSLYGDEVQSFRNTEGGVVSVVAWCSDFSAGMPALSRYFTICILPDHYATPRTFLDIWEALAPRIARMCNSRIAHPWSRTGYQFTYSSTQGDLKWLLEKFGFHNYRSNQLCSWCSCCKNHPDISMTVGDFREEAAHRQTRVSHDQFFGRLGIAAEEYHPLFRIPGCRLERFMHDVCHSQLLGTGKVCNGSVLTYLCEVGYFDGWQNSQYPVAMARCLRAAYLRFNEWKSSRKLGISQPRFTPARLSRSQRTSYPSLSSKAVAGKAISFWLTSCAIEHGRRDGATDLDRHVANCMWTYSEVLRLLDDPWQDFARERLWSLRCLR